jgi:hypothetical protein
MAPNMYTFTFELLKAQLGGALGFLQTSSGGKTASIFFDGFEYTVVCGVEKEREKEERRKKGGG